MLPSVPMPSPVAPLDAAARDRLAECFGALCVAAGAVVMEVYRAGCEARVKDDRSPVTEADERAEALILAGLADALPGWPVLAEEAAARGEGIAACARFILVDPLDGTREFLNRNGEFTVNIGLVADGVPVAGAVYAPVLERLWSGGATARVRRIAPGGRPRRGHRGPPAAHPAGARRRLDGAGQPVARRPRDRGAAGAAAGRRASGRGLVAEVLRRRRGRGRRLSPLRAHDGMGHRRR